MSRVGWAVQRESNCYTIRIQFSAHVDTGVIEVEVLTNAKEGEKGAEDREKLKGEQQKG